MAHIHNALHHFTTVQDAYRRAVGETGPEFEGIERGGETLYPILDLWSRPEFAYLRGEYQFADTNVEAAGGAGLRSMAQIHNDSLDALVVLQPGCLFEVGTGNVVVLSRSNVQLTTDDGLCLASDSRLSRPEVPFARQRSQTVAIPAGITAGQFWVAGGGNTGVGNVYRLDFPIVMRPGSCLTAYAAADQVQIRANWCGWVRRMLPGEQVGLSD